MVAPIKGVGYLSLIPSVTIPMLAVAGGADPVVTPSMVRVSPPPHIRDPLLREGQPRSTIFIYKNEERMSRNW
jgi:hypothetical protein